MVSDEYINRQFAEASLDEFPEFAYDTRWFFEYVDRITQLYVSYRKKYVVMRFGGMPYIPKNSDGSFKKLDNGAMVSHMLRRQAVSVFAGPYSAKFMCFDVDDGNADTVHKIINKAEEIGIPRDLMYVSSSGNKGYHIEVFFDDLVYTYQMAAFYKKICRDCSLDEKKVEFRPTHGQAIKLPLSIHRVTGNVCWYLDQETLEPIESLEYLFEIKQMGKDAFVKIFEEKCRSGYYAASIASKSNEYQEEIEKPQSSHEVIVADGWPMLTEPQMRFKTITAIAVYERYHGAEAEDLKERLYEWIKVQPDEFVIDPPEVVAYDIEKVVGWVFSPKFKCASEEKSAVFTELDISTILNQDSKARRKFMFLAKLYEKKYGALAMSCQRIGEYIGCSLYYVNQHIIPNLMSQGVLKKSVGQWKVVNGNLLRDTNKYWTLDDEHCRKIPCTQRFVEIGERLTPERFDAIYYGLLAKMVTSAELSKHLSKSEIKWIKENGKNEKGLVDRRDDS